MTTATADKEVSVNSGAEEPAVKKIRLDDEASSNIEDPSENDQTNSSSSTQVHNQGTKLVLKCTGS